MPFSGTSLSNAIFFRICGSLACLQAESSLLQAESPLIAESPLLQCPAYNQFPTPWNSNRLEIENVLPSQGCRGESQRGLGAFQSTRRQQSVATSHLACSLPALYKIGGKGGVQDSPMCGSGDEPH